MASNYDDVLAQLRAAGLLVERLEIGVRQRCQVEDGGREKRGWYHLHELRLDSGDEVIVGSFGQWRGNENNAQKVELRKTKLSVEQRESLKARLAEDKKRADAEARRVAERAAARATKAWRGCVEHGESDYLHRKHVQGHGVRYSPQGALVIPMLNVAGLIQGLQIIRGKAQMRAGKLEKEFWPAGLTKKGHFHQIGMIGEVVLVAEGYATAASLHEATGLPVAVAFDAGNLLHVAMALRKRYKRTQILVCADDDATQKCRAAECRGRVWLPDGDTCPHCGQPHGASNAGVTAAANTALAVGGGWIAPRFADESGRRADWLDRGRKLNDFNDLHAAEGLQAVRAQVEARLSALGWRPQQPRGRGSHSMGGGVAPDGLAPTEPLRPIDDLNELLERFALVYGQGGTVFDHQEHILMATGDMRDACLTRELHRAWAEHPDKQMVRVQEVGFDPACADPAIRCNLWAGWPTAPRAGECSTLLELLYHMCKAERRSEDLYHWVLKWLAYPIQHPGAKMRTTLVIHGPQGAGKNMFFEAIMAIYGRYGRVIDQAAIEDKFNDWSSRKLFLIADEVVARSDLYHVKNKLKAFITGDWIRINPKNMAAYDERNHVNLVFLSNEAMPVVLEDDDRRHAVIWTPAKLDHAFYAGCRAEIADGGIAALHDYLLHLDLGDFHEASLPPMTDAKRELIDLSKDSPSRFYEAYEGGQIDGFPARSSSVGLLSPVLPLDLYELYKLWCGREGLRALPNPRFSNALMRKHGKTTRQQRWGHPGEVRGPSGITYLAGGAECPPGAQEAGWIADRVDAFRASLKKYRESGTASAFV